MGLRNKKFGFSIQQVLRGRTLRDIIESGTTIKINCDECSRSTVWSPTQARKEERLRTFMSKPIEELAENMHCASCRSRNFFLTIQVARNPLL